MSKPRIYDALGEVPGHVAPSQPVRYWHRAFTAAALVFALLYPLLLALTWMLPGHEHLIAYPRALKGGLATAAHWGTLGLTLGVPAQEFLDYAAANAPWSTALRVFSSFGVALVVAGHVFSKSARPHSNTWHVAGPRLLEEREAVAEARRRSLPSKEAKADPFAMSLHPDLVLPKKAWSRHVLIHGSVGSGKSVILKFILKQLEANKHAKLFCYDIKGDFTSILRRPIIVSPFDRRSYVWDVAADVRTPTQAAAFSASIIPEGDGSSKFWTMAAQDLFIGSLRELQNTKGTEWNWTDLARMLRRSASEMGQGLRMHYPRAATLVANPDSQTTGSVLATLAGFTRLIEDLAMAWPTVGKRRFAITEWIRDDYTGRKQVIVQSGPDPTLTKAYISAMINVAVPDLISPALPDNEAGRGLYFVFDELTSAGRLNIDPLLALGRSKGVVAIMAVQDHSQIELVYGEKTAQAVASLVGAQLVCQVQMGATREKIANQLGKRKLAWRNHGDKAELHEEARALISPGELTDRLGFRKGRGFGPEKWGIRALLQMGGDVLVLDWPGKCYPQVREGQVAAAWTMRPAGPAEPDTAASCGGAIEQAAAHSISAERQPEGLTEEEIDALFNGYSSGPARPSGQANSSKLVRASQARQ